MLTVIDDDLWCCCHNQLRSREFLDRVVGTFSILLPSAQSSVCRRPVRRVVSPLAENSEQNEQVNDCGKEEERKPVAAGQTRVLLNIIMIEIPHFGRLSSVIGFVSFRYWM